LTRLGLHVNNPGNEAAIRTYVDRVQPAVMKFLAEAFNPGLMDYCRARGAKVVGRVVLDENDQKLGAPGARSLRDIVMPKAREYKAHLDYIEAFNEAFDGRDAPQEIDRYAELCVDFMKMCEDAGMKAAIFSFSVGTPELDRWSREPVLAALDHAGRNGHVVSLHEYYKPRPWTWLAEGAWTDWGRAWGYLMLRSVRGIQLWREAGIVVPRVVITESGRDDIAGTPGTGKGFRDERTTPDGDYADFMQGYMRHLTHNGGYLGAVDFGFSTVQPEKWGSFDLARDVAMLERVMQTQAQLPVAAVGGDVLRVTDRPSNHTSSRAGQAVRWIVVHSTDSPANATPDGTGRYLQQNDRQVSIHEYVLARNDVWRMVADDRAAHHCESETVVFPDGLARQLANEATWGIEGFQRQGQVVDAGIVETMAQRVAAACRRFSLAPERVLAHREIDPGRRTDPVGVDMNAFRARIRAILGPAAPPSGPDRPALLAEAQRRQVIQLNPNAALQRVMAADAFIPTSGEFDWTDASGQYVAQRAESLASGEVRVYYAKKGDFGNVKFVRR